MWVQVGWQRHVGSLDLGDPANFLSLVNRQPEPGRGGDAGDPRPPQVASSPRPTPSAGRNCPSSSRCPRSCCTPTAGELALPNLLTPLLDRRECSRTVVLVETVPAGGGQALRLLSDRGVHIAVTAAAAAGADPTDLYGWRRWAVIFPPEVVQGQGGDRRPDHPADRVGDRQPRHPPHRRRRLLGRTRELAEHNIHLTLGPANVRTSRYRGTSVHVGHRPRSPERARPHNGPAMGLPLWRPIHLPRSAGLGTGRHRAETGSMRRYPTSLPRIGPVVR